MTNPDAPIAALLYAGPTGVGKTELAKQLALEMYGSTHMVRLNMAEFHTEWSTSRLIGSPPGYMDSEKGGQLTDPLLKNPYSIVLLDEVDKAHSKVLKFFLQAFDEGQISTAMGKVVNCRHAIFILTTNHASDAIMDLSKRGMTSEQISERIETGMMSILSPELYNRLDLVVFNPLKKEIMESLVLARLQELHHRIFSVKEITVQFDDSIIHFLIQNGYHPELGARPLKRLIVKELTTLIAKVIIQGDCSAGDSILISYVDKEVVLEIIHPDEGVKGKPLNKLGD